MRKRLTKAQRWLARNEDEIVIDLALVQHGKLRVEECVIKWHIIAVGEGMNVNDIDRELCAFTLKLNAAQKK